MTTAELTLAKGIVQLSLKNSGTDGSVFQVTRLPLSNHPGCRPPMGSAVTPRAPNQTVPVTVSHSETAAQILKTWTGDPTS